ncbi:MAG TPA: hypothetical protein VFX53_09445 [Pedococcus sp.]|nr:hypothetical protein [Pedococcus sp.]
MPEGRDRGETADIRDAPDTTDAPDPAETTDAAAAPAAMACATCGAAPADPALARLTWARGIENGQEVWTCDTCSRRHLRSIEGKLDSSWW